MIALAKPRSLTKLPVREWTWAARAFAENRVLATTELVQRHGHLVKMPHLRDVFIATHPDDIERVLVANAANYKRSFDYRVLADLLGQGLITNEGEPWLRDRRLQQPFFHHKMLAGFFTTMTAATERALARFAAADAPVSFSTAMQKLALDIIGARLFGEEAEGEAEAITACIDEMQPELIRRVLSPIDWRRYVWTPGGARFARSLKKLDRILGDRVAARRADSREHADLLSTLLAANMSNEWVRDHVVTTFVTGHETSAAALCWMAALLAQHPEVFAKAREEVDSVLGGRAPTYEDLKRLPYLRACAQETLRLYPSVPTFGREAIAADTLSGVMIPAKSTVAFCVYTTQRHPDFWSDGETFTPERFLGDHKKPRYAYLPFGAGQRICIGQMLAEAEMMLVFSLLVHRFDLALVEQKPIEAVAGVSYRPKGALPMHVTVRK